MYAYNVYRLGHGKSYLHILIDTLSVEPLSTHLSVIHEMHEQSRLPWAMVTALSCRTLQPSPSMELCLGIHCLIPSTAFPRLGPRCPSQHPVITMVGWLQQRTLLTSGLWRLGRLLSVLRRTVRLCWCKMAIETVFTSLHRKSQSWETWPIILIHVDYIITISTKIHLPRVLEKMLKKNT